MKLTIFIFLLGLSYGSVLNPRTNSSTVSAPDYNNLTVAIVRAAPANWPMPILNKNWTGVEFDLNATVAKGVTLIREAARNDANLIVFPELWFPGYPKGLADNVTIADHLQNYVDNSLVIGSSQWQKIIETVKNESIYAALGFSHKEDGLLYMGQALISPEGEVLLLRHKLRPSGGERGIWSDGTKDELKVVATPYGRWGILECWEHFHPAMTFITQAQIETLHIASFPYTPDANDSGALSWESEEVNVAAARTYAVNSGAPFIFASVGNVRFIDSSGMDLSVTPLSTSIETVPLVYQSFNTTGMAATEPYDADAQQSWDVLEEIKTGFPSYIPKVHGNLVPHEEFPISGLLASVGNSTG
ncbi:hypothetical protein BCIN_13g05670 [Botrytis cinerea B05.10]|uniref:nitrilase n=3 Tax=Botryotinia fuckeliana TaxID=40559 RepID=A0A384K1N0_BOTFB|nr:hypothetical protein BCIN_13g05670 [Botrytis cinerea B05.10]ATZ56735.1 hypothetical protein BCIN_13g05670 [Botrytis cinerea B05.10]EMR80560.1 putative aliphatic nitrilase protein [Botrytis cinerea BcDW1]CCD33863.1 similar to aliphatic nitrilase [Botrytis cinerea T4]